MNTAHAISATAVTVTACRVNLVRAIRVVCESDNKEREEGYVAEEICICFSLVECFSTFSPPPAILLLHITAVLERIMRRVHSFRTCLLSTFIILLSLQAVYGFGIHQEIKLTCGTQKSLCMLK